MLYLVSYFPFSLLPPVAADILDPSYLPLKRDARGTDYVDGSSTSPIPRNPTLELGEFPPLDSYHPHTSYQPHYSFNHHMYVYPAHLKYDNQKSFTKVSKKYRRKESSRVCSRDRDLFRVLTTRNCLCLLLFLCEYNDVCSKCGSRMG